jgi:hypothetical protein
MAVRVGERTTCETYLFEGEPDDVLEQATDRAVALLATTLVRHVPARAGPVSPRAGRGRLRARPAGPAA